MAVEFTGKGLIGTGFAEAAKEVGRKLREDHEQNFQRRENEIADEQARAREGKHEYFLLVSRASNGFVKVTSIEEFPLIGRLGAVGRSFDAAIVELRFAYAYELHKRGLLPSMDEARRYATRCTFRADVGQSKLILT